MMDAAAFFSPASVANPYQIYDGLRQAAPVFFFEAQGRWILTRYADVDALLRDPGWLAGGNRLANMQRLRPPEHQAEVAPLFHALARQMLFADPPDHTRLRALANRAFTPRAVERMRARIQTIVDELLDHAAAADAVDLIHDFAYPLPAIVISEMLGIPRSERDEFKRWSDAFGLLLANVHGDVEIDRRAGQNIQEANAYFAAAARRLREQPQNDLLSALVLAEEQGSHLTEEELLANALLLLAAGHETTTNLIGNGALALLRHPEQRERWRANPALAPIAVEELLRYDSPVQLTVRAAPTDREVGDQLIRQGQSVLCVLGAANRDPEQFPRPHALDLGRQPNRHLAFGAGIHFCLGAPLARLEGQIAMNTLLARFPDLRLAGPPPEFQPNHVFRGLKVLPVALS
jgi:cytochrome P450